jgi:hypothetical protein
MSNVRALAEYDRLLATIGEKADAIGTGRLAAHWPHVGTAYRGLVIVGQALQGWDPAVTGSRFHAIAARTADGRAAIIEQTRTWFADAPEPVGVIATLSNRQGSPFWRLCRDVVEVLEPHGDGPWYSRFAWANVYPVGPDAPPGSPGGPLKEAQDSHVGSLLVELLGMLDARRVVVISGPTYWWHPSRTPMFTALPVRDFPLLQAGLAEGRSVVVGYHPTYARRRKVRGDAYAELVARTIEEIDQWRPGPA